jgi:hypothetical protein
MLRNRVWWLVCSAIYVCCVTDVAARTILLTLGHHERSTHEQEDEVRSIHSGRDQFTQAMRARVLRDELQHRFQHLADLLYDVTRGPDDPEEVEVVAIASAVEHLRAAVEAIDNATHG